MQRWSVARIVRINAHAPEIVDRSLSESMTLVAERKEDEQENRSVWTRSFALFRSTCRYPYRSVDRFFANNGMGSRCLRVAFRCRTGLSRSDHTNWIRRSIDKVIKLFARSTGNNIGAIGLICSTTTRQVRRRLTVSRCLLSNWLSMALAGSGFYSNEHNWLTKYGELVRSGIRQVRSRHKLPEELGLLCTWTKSAIRDEWLRFQLATCLLRRRQNLTTAWNLKRAIFICDNTVCGRQ